MHTCCINSRKQLSGFTAANYRGPLMKEICMLPHHNCYMLPVHHQLATSKRSVSTRRNQLFASAVSPRASMIKRSSSSCRNLQEATKSLFTMHKAFSRRSPAAFNIPHVQGTLQKHHTLLLHGVCSLSFGRARLGGLPKCRTLLPPCSHCIKPPYLCFP